MASNALVKPQTHSGANWPSRRLLTCRNRQQSSLPEWTDRAYCTAMALTATMYHLRIDLSDVDRNVYAPLDLRIARHPSESMRHMLARTIAYCLCYEEGIAFSKGLSTA